MEYISAEVLTDALASLATVGGQVYIINCGRRTDAGTC